MSKLILILKYIKQTINKKIKYKLLNISKELGFLNYNYHYIHGPIERLHLHPSVKPQNNIFFNTRSGDIYIGEGTKFGFNCMILTGRHLFENGSLKSTEQVPLSGYDINIGSGCWIASGSIIIGGVKIGDNCIVMAGAIVTKDVPDGMVVGGIPAKIIKKITEID